MSYQTTSREYARNVGSGNKVKLDHNHLIRFQKVVKNISDNKLASKNKDIQKIFLNQVYEEDASVDNKEPIKLKRLQLVFSQPRHYITSGPPLPPPNKILNSTILMLNDLQGINEQAIDIDSINVEYYINYKKILKERKQIAKFEASIDSIVLSTAKYLLISGVFVYIGPFAFAYFFSYMGTLAAPIGIAASGVETAAAALAAAQTAAGGVATEAAAAAIATAQANLTIAQAALKTASSNLEWLNFGTQFVSEVFFDLTPQESSKVLGLIDTIKQQTIFLCKNPHFGDDPSSIFHKAFNGKNPLINVNPFTDGLKPEDLAYFYKSGKNDVASIDLPDYQKAVLELSNFMIDKALGPFFGNFFKYNSNFFTEGFGLPEIPTINLEEVTPTWVEEQLAKQAAGLFGINEKYSKYILWGYKGGMYIKEKGSEIYSTYSKYKSTIDKVFALFQPPTSIGSVDPPVEEGYFRRILNKATHSQTVKSKLYGNLLDYFELNKGQEVAKKISEFAEGVRGKKGPPKTGMEGYVETSVLFFRGKAADFVKASPQNFIGYTTRVFVDTVGNKISASVESYAPNLFAPVNKDVPATPDDDDKKKAEEHAYQQELRNMRILYLNQGKKDDEYSKLMREAAIMLKPNGVLNADDYTALEYAYTNIQWKARELYKKGFGGQIFMVWGSFVTTSLFSQILSYSKKPSAAGVEYQGNASIYNNDLLSSLVSPWVSLLANKYKADATQKLSQLATEIQKRAKKITDDIYIKYIQTPILNSDIMKSIFNKIREGRDHLHISQDALSRIYLGIYIQQGLNQLIDLVFDTIDNFVRSSPELLINEVAKTIYDDGMGINQTKLFGYELPNMKQYLTPAGWENFMDRFKGKNFMDLYFQISKVLMGQSFESALSILRSSTTTQAGVEFYWEKGYKNLNEIIGAKTDKDIDNENISLKIKDDEINETIAKLRKDIEDEHDEVEKMKKIEKLLTYIDEETNKDGLKDNPIKTPLDESLRKRRLTRFAHIKYVYTYNLSVYAKKYKEENDKGDFEKDDNGEFKLDDSGNRIPIYKGVFDKYIIDLSKRKYIDYFKENYRNIFETDTLTELSAAYTFTKDMGITGIKDAALNTNLAIISGRLLADTIYGFTEWFTGRRNRLSQVSITVGPNMVIKLKDTKAELFYDKYQDKEFQALATESFYYEHRDNLNAEITEDWIVAFAEKKGYTYRKSMLKEIVQNIQQRYSKLLERIGSEKDLDIILKIMETFRVDEIKELIDENINVEDMLLKAVADHHDTTHVLGPLNPGRKQYLEDNPRLPIKHLEYVKVGDHYVKLSFIDPSDDDQGDQTDPFVRLLKIRITPVDVIDVPSKFLTDKDIKIFPNIDNLKDSLAKYQLGNGVDTDIVGSSKYKLQTTLEAGYILGNFFSTSFIGYKDMYREVNIHNAILKFIGSDGSGLDYKKDSPVYKKIVQEAASNPALANNINIYEESSIQIDKVDREMETIMNKWDPDTKQRHEERMRKMLNGEQTHENQVIHKDLLKLYLRKKELLKTKHDAYNAALAAMSQGLLTELGQNKKTILSKYKDDLTTMRENIVRLQTDVVEVSDCKAVDPLNNDRVAEFHRIVSSLSSNPANTELTSLKSISSIVQNGCDNVDKISADLSKSLSDIDAMLRYLSIMEKDERKFDIFMDLQRVRGIINSYPLLLVKTRGITDNNRSYLNFFSNIDTHVNSAQTLYAKQLKANIISNDGDILQEADNHLAKFVNDAEKIPKGQRSKSGEQGVVQPIYDISLQKLKDDINLAQNKDEDDESYYRRLNEAFEPEYKKIRERRAAELDQRQGETLEQYYRRLEEEKGIVDGRKIKLNADKLLADLYLISLQEGSDGFKNILNFGRGNPINPVTSHLRREDAIVINNQDEFRSLIIEYNGLEVEVSQYNKYCEEIAEILAKLGYSSNEFIGGDLTAEQIADFENLKRLYALVGISEIPGTLADFNTRFDEVQKGVFTKIRIENDVLITGFQSSVSVLTAVPVVAPAVAPALAIIDQHIRILNDAIRSVTNPEDPNNPILIGLQTELQELTTLKSDINVLGSDLAAAKISNQNTNNYDMTSIRQRVEAMLLRIQGYNSNLDKRLTRWNGHITFKKVAQRLLWDDYNDATKLGIGVSKADLEIKWRPIYDYYIQKYGTNGKEPLRDNTPDNINSIMKQARSFLEIGDVNEENRSYIGIYNYNPTPLEDDISINDLILSGMLAKKDLAELGFLNLDGTSNKYDADYVSAIQQYNIT